MYRISVKTATMRGSIFFSNPGKKKLTHLLDGEGLLGALELPGGGDDVGGGDGLHLEGGSVLRCCRCFVKGADMRRFPSEAGILY